jgi:hypothetical protein
MNDDNRPDLDPRDDDPYYEFIDETPQPYWSRRRIALLIFALLIVAALLAYSLPGLFLPPPPPPTLAPGSFI